MNKNGINVLSLFDGMSCGQIALERLGIKVNNYYASEIDKYAMKVTKENYPDTEHVGSVVDVKGEDLPKIDLLFGGSPCQSFSRLGDGSGFDGSSKLFFEYVRLLKETKPKYFLLENVVMKKEWIKVITDIMGVEPIAINSKLLSAQNRPRLYWTNIPNVTQPEDLGLTVSSVLDIDDKFSSEYPNYLDLTFSGKKRKDMVKNYKTKASCLTASMYKGQISSFCKNDEDNVYKYTPNDCEILQTVPLNYTDCVSNTQRYKMLGNGWTVDVIAHIFKGLKD
jgi:DNA-cytosine methyltransferase